MKKFPYRKFIFTSDWQLRDVRPICRLEEPWIDYCLSKIQQLVSLSYSAGMPVVIGGDLFDSPTISYFFLNRLIELLSKTYCLAIPGNHDVYGRVDELERTAYGVLLKSNAINPIPAEFVVPMTSRNFNLDTDAIFTHQLITPSPFFDSIVADSIKLKPGQMLLHGDFHQMYIHTSQDTLIACPGTLIRTKRDEANLQPTYFIVDLDNFTVFPKTVSCTSQFVEETVEKVSDFSSVAALLTDFSQLSPDFSKIPSDLKPVVDSYLKKAALLIQQGILNGDLE